MKMNLCEKLIGWTCITFQIFYLYTSLLFLQYVGEPDQLAGFG